MKNKKRLLALVLCVLLTVLFCGCSSTLVDVDQLMTPPKVTGNKEALYRLLVEDAGTPEFIYPNAGEHRSAVITVPFAGKETPGAIAFCSNSDNGTTMYFVMQEGEDWRIAAKMTNTSTQVDRVCFADLNDDGRQEVVVSWGSVQALASILSVYSYNGTSVVEYNLSRPFGEFAVTDLDCDGHRELFIAEAYTELDTADPAANTTTETTVLALLYRLGLNGLEITQTVPLDPTVRRYTQLALSELPITMYGDSSAVILDGIRADGTVVSQLVYIDPLTEVLSAPFSSAMNVNVTTRASVSNVSSRDIDGDGVYELPVVHLLPAPSDLPVQSVSYMVSWQRYTPRKESTETVRNTIINATDGYMLEVPQAWLNDNVTCRYDVATGTLTVYAVEKQENSVALGAALLRIRRYSKLEWENLSETENYTAVYAQNNVIFAATLPTKDSPLTVRLSVVAELIEPISE